MNRLPQDIYDEIGAFLEDPTFDRPALATISRQWQTAIERQTFRQIRLESTDLKRFQDIVHPGRRRYVNDIYYFIVLPAYSDEARARFKCEDNRLANDEAFTAAIHDLFHILKSWDIHKDGYIQLNIRDVYSVTDHDFLRLSSRSLAPGQNLARVHKDKSSNRITDLGWWRFRYSYLRLLQPSELPIVSVVRSLITRAMLRNICDRVPIDMGAKLPNLLTGDWKLIDWENPYLALRRAHRHDLTQAISDVLPQSSGLQRLRLWMTSQSCWAPAWYPERISPENATLDPLSDAIRTTTAHIYTLKDLTVCGAVDGSLLWPSPTRALSEPYWQNLERLVVHFLARRPSGGSYFRDPKQAARSPRMTPLLEAEMPPGYGYSEDDDTEAATWFSAGGRRATDSRVLNVVPDDDSIVPLIEAFGRACLQMPMLKSAELSAPIPAPIQLDNEDRRVQGRSKWGIWYFSPGTSCRMSRELMHPAFFEDAHQRRLLWDVQDWQPSMDLSSLLGDIGREKYGDRLVERFVDSWNAVTKESRLKLYKRTS
ncbi:hypothetical protein F4677DRAFT_253505 [Hypoxylon crocopeplum]|nr:hypothetical protein F4677DRAFT_253505 [Hypoxylon crocopeplum]